MKKCPVCEENVPDDERYCKVCGEMLIPGSRDFVLTTRVEKLVEVNPWFFVIGVCAIALLFGFWLGSKIDWEAIGWHVHLH